MTSQTQDQTPFSNHLARKHYLAERSVLRHILVEEKVPHLYPPLRAEAFHFQEHGILFEILQSLLTEPGALTGVRLAEEAEKHERYSETMKEAVTAIRTLYTAMPLQEALDWMATARIYNEATQILTKLGRNTNLESAFAARNELGNAIRFQGWSPTSSSLAKNSLEGAVELFNDTVHSPKGLPWGVPELEYHLGRLMPGEVYLLSGGIADMRRVIWPCLRAATLEKKAGILYRSFQDETSMILSDMLAANIGLARGQWETGQMHSEMWVGVTKAATVLHDSYISMMTQPPDTDLRSVELELASAHTTKKIELVVLDYLVDAHSTLSEEQLISFIKRISARREIALVIMIEFIERHEVYPLGCWGRLLHQVTAWVECSDRYALSDIEADGEDIRINKNRKGITGRLNLARISFN